MSLTSKVSSKHNIPEEYIPASENMRLSSFITYQEISSSALRVYLQDSSTYLDITEINNRLIFLIGKDNFLVEQLFVSSVLRSFTKLEQVKKFLEAGNLLH